MGVCLVRASYDLPAPTLGTADPRVIDVARAVAVRCESDSVLALVRALVNFDVLHFDVADALVAVTAGRPEVVGNALADPAGTSAAATSAPSSLRAG